MWGDVSREMADAFREASRRVYLGEHRATPGTIGTQSERRLHAILKYYLSPDSARHEKKVGRYWADILTEDHRIFEVQTRRFDRLREKLDALLDTYDVTVVYPVSRDKYLVWLDPQDGTVTEPRRSPIHGSVYDCLYELFYLTAYLKHPHFHVRVLLCDMQEYRALTGFGKSRKIRAPRAERIPLALVGDYTLDTPADYRRLVPDALPPRFTQKAYAQASHIPPAAASRAIRVLTGVGVLRRAGKEKNAFLYERTEVPDERL